MSVVLSYVPTAEGRGALAFGFAEAKMRATTLYVIADGESAAEPEFAADLQSAREDADASGVVHEVLDNDPSLAHADRLIDASFDDDVDLLVIGIRGGRRSGNCSPAAGCSGFCSTRSAP